jgi:hypothetical protein
MDIRGPESAVNSQRLERPRQHVVKGSNTVPDTQPERSAAANSGPTSVVTQEEKDYFAALFPESSEAIAAHATYSPKGMHDPVRTGQMVDRKG